MAQDENLKLTWEVIRLTRKRPLRISRGVSGNTVAIWVKIESDGIEGWGAACPFSTGVHRQDENKIIATLEHSHRELADCHPLDRQRILSRLRTRFGPNGSAALAAIDTALWDWLGKLAKLPLWQLLGLELDTIPATSVTVGMEEPEVAAEIAKAWVSGEMRAEHLFPGQGGRFSILKVKLGSPQGIDIDKARLEAVLAVAEGATIIVDANAGWSWSGAREMCQWLASRGVVLIEQPLPVGADTDWRRLHDLSPLPLFADESCFVATDIVRLAEYCDGVVIKMMKAGGLSEALQMINTARACGLGLMLGCYADSTLANSAMTQLAALVDYVDLDSQFNLKNDPFCGSTVIDGRLIPSQLPGIGVALKDA